MFSKYAMFTHKICYNPIATAKVEHIKLNGDHYFHKKKKKKQAPGGPGQALLINK